MSRLLLRAKARLRDATKPAAEAAIGALTVGMLRTTRYFDPDKTAKFFGHAAHFIGRRLREDRIGRENLKAAFPEKSPEEIEEILTGVWHNLGRIGAEFAHLGNWELPALGAVAHGLDAAILYRRPNIQSADRAIERIRKVQMGTLVPAGRDAPFKLGQALQNGQHVAMLVDQYLTNGVPVTFFGRKTTANPMLARLRRQVDCPIHGTRIIRLPNGRFRAELSEEVKPVFDASGQIDVQGTMQAITDVVESWVREYPDQWLWLHRRWR
jgi:KDO2-lipid IV(A) lauroyltransferase